MIGIGKKVGGHDHPLRVRGGKIFHLAGDVELIVGIGEGEKLGQGQAGARAGEAFLFSAAGPGKNQSQQDQGHDPDGRKEEISNF